MCKLDIGTLNPNNCPNPAIGSPDGFFAELWQEAEFYRWQTLNSDFVQQLISGTLSPDRYGRFVLLDLYYCLKAADDFLLAIENSQYDDDKSFLLNRYHDHIDYMGKAFAEWPINDPDSLTPSSTIKDFVAYQHRIADTDGGIYFVLAITPCMALWTWLGLLLNERVPKDSLYRHWVNVNQVQEAPRSFANHINKNIDRIDKEKAAEIFRNCMRYECNMFRSGGHQPPL